MSARTAGVVRALGWMACISASSSYRARHRAQSAKRAPPAQNEPDPNNVLQPNTYFNWKKKFDGMTPPEMRRLKQLEDENAKLKKLVADLSLDREMLQDIVRRKL